MHFKRIPITIATIASLAAVLAGCASEPEQAKQAAAAPSPIEAAGPGLARTNTEQSDAKTLQAGRAQDANVINDANKAVGVLGR